MSLFEITGAGMQRIPAGSFAAEGVLERNDLQQWIRNTPEVLGENLLVIAEEFGQWEESKRRIDLLALDEDANLVVIELKRTEDGGHMDLQAIRYAAMISTMRFDDVVRTFEEHLGRNDPERVAEARSRPLQFLGASEGEPVEISNAPRIILVSGDFSLEITTAVLWLIDQGLRIRCLQMVPYKVGEKMLVDLRQVIPLAKAGDYQVRLRQKGEATRQATSQARRELTLKVLQRHGVIQAGTEIEVVPQAPPADGPQQGHNAFRASIGDLSVRASIIWLHDNNAYSLTQLTSILAQDHGLTWFGTKTAVHWRVAGHSVSLWEEAERLLQEEV
jgi:hypothetical protein